MDERRSLFSFRTPGRNVRHAAVRRSQALPRFRELAWCIRWDGFSGWQVAGVCYKKFRGKRSRRRAVSPGQRRLAGLDEWRLRSTLAARQQGAFLYCSGQPDHGCRGGRARIDFHRGKSVAIVPRKFSSIRRQSGRQEIPCSQPERAENHGAADAGGELARAAEEITKVLSRGTKLVPHAGKVVVPIDR